MSPFEALVAERWQRTRFGEDILAKRAERDAEAILHEAEQFLESQHTEPR